MVRFLHLTHIECFQITFEKLIIHVCSFVLLLFHGREWLDILENFGIDIVGFPMSAVIFLHREAATPRCMYCFCLWGCWHHGFLPLDFQSTGLTIIHIVWLGSPLVFYVSKQISSSTILADWSNCTSLRPLPLFPGSPQWCQQFLLPALGCRSLPYCQQLCQVWEGLWLVIELYGWSWRWLEKYQ